MLLSASDENFAEFDATERSIGGVQSIRHGTPSNSGDIAVGLYDVSDAPDDASDPAESPQVSVESVTTAFTGLVLNEPVALAGGADHETAIPVKIFDGETASSDRTTPAEAGPGSSPALTGSANDRLVDANNGEPAVDLDGHSGATAAQDQPSASGPDEAGIGEAIEVAFGVGMTVLEGAALAWSDLFPDVDDTDWQLETTVYEAARDILDGSRRSIRMRATLMPAKGLALEDQTTKGVFVAEDYFLPEPGIDHGLRKTELGAGLGDIDVLDVVSEGFGGAALDTSSAAETEITSC